MRRNVICLGYCTEISFAIGVYIYVINCYQVRISEFIQRSCYRYKDADIMNAIERKTRDPEKAGNAGSILLLAVRHC